MALLKTLIFSKSLVPIAAANSYRNIQTTAIRVIDMKWREDRRLHRNPNAHGPLTDFPDYTFMNDDRPTPLGVSEFSINIKQTKKQSFRWLFWILAERILPINVSFFFTFLSFLQSNQKKRIIKQRQLAQRIVTLINEVDDAKLRHKRLQDEKQKDKENVIANKLKPKGLLLLKNKT